MLSALRKEIYFLKIPILRNVPPSILEVLCRTGKVGLFYILMFPIQIYVLLGCNY